MVENIRCSLCGGPVIETIVPDEKDENVEYASYTCVNCTPPELLKT